MRVHSFPVAALALAALAGAPAQGQGKGDPRARNDGAYAQTVEALLSCQADRATFRDFSLSIGDPVTGVAAHGWTPVEGSDASYPHYKVAPPLYVFGVEVREIVFSADAILGLLDSKDGVAVAKAAGLSQYQYRSEGAAFYGMKQVYPADPQSAAASGSSEQRHLVLTSEMAAPHHISIGCTYSIAAAPEKK